MKDDLRNTRAWGRFNTFHTLKDAQLIRMKHEAASFLDDLLNDRSPRWLSLLGTSGAGKTMVAKIIAKTYRQEKHGEIDWNATKATQNEYHPHGRFIRYRGGFINWGNAINSRMLKGDYEFLEDMCSYPFFAIDDIASEYEKHRALSASKLYQVFESRLKKWTIITGNLSLEQIGVTLDSRIASRMIRDNGVVVDVAVPDYALREIVA